MIDMAHISLTPELRNLTQQRLLAQLNDRLGGQVRAIRVEHHFLTNTDHVQVRFMNMHTLNTTLPEILSDEFIATCVLVYDLPYRGPR